MPARLATRLPLPACAVALALLVAAAPAAAAGGSGGMRAFEASSATGGVSAGSWDPDPVPAVDADTPTGGLSPADVESEQTGTVVAPPAGGDVVPADVPFGALIAETARRYDLPVALFTALVWQESGFRERARSRAGARGLTQLMPATARELGVRRIYDPAENLDGGARYLRAQLDRFGSVRLALAAYNAGPGAVRRHRGVPPYRETRRYVRNVLALQARLERAGVR